MNKTTYRIRNNMKKTIIISSVVLALAVSSAMWVDHAIDADVQESMTAKSSLNVQPRDGNIIRVYKQQGGVGYGDTLLQPAENHNEAQQANIDQDYEASDNLQPATQVNLQ